MQPPPVRRRWTRQELLIVLHLYCRIPFGQSNSRNREVIRVAQAIGRTPGAVAMKLGNFGSFDEGLRQRGISGLPNASAGDREIWQEMNADWAKFATAAFTAQQEFELLDETEIAESPKDEGQSDQATERQGVVTQRVGQDFFRKAVLSAYNYRCCIAGLRAEQLLVASHIVPWSVDEQNRVNPRNGLLLSALHDKAFDRGLITLDDDLIIRVSRNYSPVADEFFTQAIAVFDGQPITPPEKLRPHPDFLAYHREHVFLG